MRKQLKIITDQHLEEYEEYMVLKNLSKRTIYSPRRIHSVCYNS